jgi:hypothetical protein
LKTPPNIPVWVEGERHPDTPISVFKRVRDYDHIRRLIPGRCKICKYVISSDEKVVKELVFVCDDAGCNCKKMYGAISHRVCNLCYDLFHALYVNYLMRDLNYFKAIDEAEKKNNDDQKRRDRMGL